MSSFLLPTISLLKREVVRFLRQRHRIIGALGTPALVWILIGSGLGNSFNTHDGLNYLQYFFPGTVTLVLLFTAIFSTISIIEDRREGFLQAVLVAPISRSAIVWGKLLGGALLAFGQGLLFLCISPLLGVSIGFSQLTVLLSVMFLLSIGLTGLGFVIAWKLDSTQGFHAIMNLFLMPLWFLSGSLFPLQGAPHWLQIVMRLDPLTYSVGALHQSLYQSPTELSPWPSLTTSFWVTLVFAALMAVVCTWVVSKKEKPS